MILIISTLVQFDLFIFKIFMFGSCIFNFGLYTFKRFILLLVFVRSDYFGRFKMKMNRQKWSIFNSIETRHLKL